MQESLVNAWLIGLGLGMVILSIVGAATNAGTQWLTWLDLAVAVISMFLAASMKRLIDNRTLYGGVVTLSLGVFALWIAAIIVHAPPLLVWWNFGFAVAFLFVGIAALAKKREGNVVRKFPPRRAA